MTDAHSTRRVLGRRYASVVATLLLLLTTFSCGPAPDRGAPKIVGYVHGSRSHPPTEIDVGRLTHINYAFTRIEDGEVLPPTPSDSVNLARLRGLKAVNPDLSILISVGGWSGSGGFSDAALTQESRERFARSAVQYVLDADIDGVDLDWEYPGQPGAGNMYRPEDRENFTLMLKTLREHLDRAARDQVAGEGRYLLTIATGASQTYLDHTDLREAQRHLDFINIMTYDFSGTWTDTVWHHTNLRAATGEGASGRGADVGVEEHIRAGVPAHKLVLGVAFYGRGWHGVQGLNKPGGDSTFSLSYHEITDLERAGLGFVRVWDDEALAPYLWNETEGTFITYDDTVSLWLKAEFVKDEGLGGVMYWEHSADSTGALLETLHRHLHLSSD